MKRALALLAMAVAVTASAQDKPRAEERVDLPIAPTEIQVIPSRVSQQAPDAGGKPTAGDKVILLVKPSAEMGEGAVPNGIADKLEKGSVEWGGGRILAWKPYDSATGAITLVWTSYTPGKVEIQSVPFTNGGRLVFATPVKEVEFGSVGGDKSKDDIYEPESVRLPTWVMVLLALVSLGLVLALIHFLLERHRKKKAERDALASAPKVLTPHEAFEKVRAETLARKYIDQGKFKPHYFAISEAAKKFLGASYYFDAEERTTRELLRELEQVGMSVELVDRWEKLFDEMDIVKFTDQVPELEAARSIADRLAEVVLVSWTRSPAARELIERQKAERLKEGRK